jgi:phosphatidylethanolamine/phosphatidyl-N-methylethanolamine N-methyltransferase
MTSEQSRDSWYEHYYSKINVSASKGSFITNLYHNLLEKRFKTNLDKKILEVGANQAEHLSYVVEDYSNYILTDLREVIVEMPNSRVRFQQANLESLPFADSNFDRVIATCVFHHVNDPERGFEEIRRVLRDGGSFSLMLPNDPGLAYRVFRRATSLRKAQKLGILKEARLAHSREHRNHYLALKMMVEWVFKDDQISFKHFPFGLPIYDLNLLTICTIQVKKPGRLLS